jgi:hypothetical protein
MANSSLQIRGPLRYQVETSTPQIEAGKEFSVFIRITNPYDVEAKLKGVTTKLPAKFQDIEALNRDRKKEQYMERLDKLTKHVLSERVPEIKQAENEKKAWPRKIIKDVLREITPLWPLAVGTYDAAQYVKASTLSTQKDLDKELLNPANIELIVEKVEQSPKPTEELSQIVMDQLRTKLREAEEYKQPEVTLQPGNSIVQAFTLKTTQAILFAPSTYNLNLQIEYEIDAHVNQDSVGYQLNVRAPLKALISGAVVGSVTGYFVRDIFDQKVLLSLIQNPTRASFASWLVALFGNVLIAALLVIAFARKKDAQPILSIEDFWGGVFVGFLAGYTGKSVLDQF